MIADSFVHPMAFLGNYYTGAGWAGYRFKSRLDYGSWLRIPGYHLGIDYNHGTDDQGDTVVSVANGIVRRVGASGTYGARIVIEHTLSAGLAALLKTKTLMTLYGHVQNWVVRVGQTVKKGQKICQVGKAGTKFAHLHFEMYKPHNYSAVTSRVSKGYPADNLANINANYYDGFKVIDQNKKPIEVEEMFKTDAEVKEAYLMLRGSTGTTTERKGWIGQSKQRFFQLGKKEADSIRKQLSDIKRALAAEKAKPAKEVIKTVKEIVEVPVEKIVKVEVPVEVVKEVEVPAEVNEQEVVTNWFKKIWDSLFNRGNKNEG